MTLASEGIDLGKQFSSVIAEGASFQSDEKGMQALKQRQSTTDSRSPNEKTKE